MRALREAVVVAREDSPGDKRLAAYYVGGEELNAGGCGRIWRHRCGLRVPASYMGLEALPLTPHGKLDRKALPVAGGVRMPSTRAMKRREGEAEEGRWRPHVGESF